MCGASINAGFVVESLTVGDPIFLFENGEEGGIAYRGGCSSPSDLDGGSADPGSDVLGSAGVWISSGVVEDFDANGSGVDEKGMAGGENEKEED